MVICPACGQENPDRAKFCGECAWPLARLAVCPVCGFENPVGQKFCNDCAQPLLAESESPPLERDPREYTPKHLAEKILQSKSAMEGERKQVTVLFADVKGSMQLASQVDPEEWHRILDRFFQILASGVHRFEGTVNQYTGDGIMALFGAPIAHEDHAQRACRAALYLTGELRRYAKELRLTRSLSFSVRMGLNSGEVVVGKIGDDLRMDYTAQGHTVGLAARMEQISEPGKIYLTEATAALVRGYFELEDLGELCIRSAKVSLRVFQLEGPGPLRTRFDVSRARGLTRFVGRDADMAVLEAALEEARSGNGQVVGVAAEAGVGKSRLCYEFVARCRARGLAVLEGRALARGRNVPLLPMLQVFRAYCGIEDHDSDRVAREKVAGRLLLIDEEFREFLPLVFEFFGVPDPERPAPRMDPEARQRRLFGALRRVLQKGNAHVPDVTLIEDLHRMDAASEAFLEEWVNAIAGTRSLLLVNFRPDYSTSWMQKPHYHRLSLSPLGSQSTRELLRDLLGSDPSLGDLADAIHERTAGNPFFTEEVVQSLIEAGNLEGTRGRYRLVTPIEALRVPSTVQSVLAARIDRLGEREKRLLQTAAVIGREFAEPILEVVAELPGAELADALAALTAAEFIYERALYPVAEYAFKHPLTQEVALGSQLQERRRRVHGAVARAIEASQADKLDERAALLAHHLEEAGEALPAARWHRRAAEWAGLTNPAEAIRHFARVRSLVAKLPQSHQAQGLAVAACWQTLRLAYHVGLSKDEAEMIFEEGRDLAERSGESRLLAVMLGVYAPVRGILFGDIEGWAHYGCAAFELASRAGVPALELAISTSAQAPLHFLGRLRESLDVAHCVLGAPSSGGEGPYPGARGDPFYLLSTGLRGLTLACLGRLEESAHEIEKTIDLARQEGESEILADAHGWRAFTATLRGEPEAALAHAQRAVEIAETLGVPLGQSHAHLALGHARALRGEWDDARHALEVARAIIRESHTGLNHEPAVLAQLADAVGRGGDEKRARTVAEEAVSLARERRTVIFEIAALVIWARILLRSDGASVREEIEVALARALTLIDETGARIYEPLALEERAGLARLLGDDAACDRHLRQARRLYAEMGATGHAERLARELPFRPFGEGENAKGPEEIL
jgi:class 3 adenylate cyclase/tetratricopeptide (TPR) repeat protein